MSALIGSSYKQFYIGDTVYDSVLNVDEEQTEDSHDITEKEKIQNITAKINYTFLFTKKKQFRYSLGGTLFWVRIYADCWHPPPEFV